MIIAAMILIALATAARALSETSLVLFLTTAGVGTGIAVAGALIGGFVKSNYHRQACLSVSSTGSGRATAKESKISTDAAA